MRGFLVAATLGLWLGNAVSARACSIVEYPFGERLMAAPIVVHGVVRRVEPNAAELEVLRAIRGQQAKTFTIENREIGYGASCEEILEEDGRFSVGDELLVFADVPTGDQRPRPIGVHGDGVFIRKKNGFSWVRFPRTRFAEPELLSFAENGGDLYTAAEALTRDARIFMGPRPDPPPISPNRRGCAVERASKDGELLFGVLLLAGLAGRVFATGRRSTTGRTNTCPTAGSHPATCRARRQRPL